MSRADPLPGETPDVMFCVFCGGVAPECKTWEFPAEYRGHLGRVHWLCCRHCAARGGRSLVRQITAAHRAAGMTEDDP